ncbi:MAG: T9SS type A sorting domain-containing protein, partial [Bacteroidota bacterium]
RSFLWNTQKSSWTFESRASYTYDEEGKMIEEIHYDEEDLPMSRFKSSYNERGYLKELLEYTSYPRGDEWSEVFRLSFLYDKDAKLYREEQEYKDPTTQSWVLNYYSLIYGKTHSEALLEEAESIPLSCNFPNPYTSKTPFNCTEMLSGKAYQLELLDMAGRRLEVQNVIGDEIISLQAQVPQGLYLLLIKDQSQVLMAERIYIQQP